MEACYVCGSPSVTKDHFPPRAFFPEAKDMPASTPDLRRNLWTLPACQEHNGDQSTDDEVTAYALAFHFENNEVGLSQAVTKILRALRRDARKRSMVLKDRRQIEMDGKKTLAFHLDLERARNVFDRIAAGLYFTHFGQRIPKPVVEWLSPALRHGDGQPDASAVSLAQGFSTVSDSDPSHLHSGSIGHESVFQYAIYGDADAYFFRLTFYEGFVVLGAPPDPANDLHPS